MKIFKLFLGIISVILFASCSDEFKTTNPPISDANLLYCFNNTEWNDIMIRDSLIGKWCLIYIYNPWQGGSKIENGKTEIEFRDDSTLNIFENNELTITTKWTVIENNDYFELNTDTSSYYLKGHIFLCGEIVKFNASYRDLLDNYFERTE